MAFLLLIAFILGIWIFARILSPKQSSHSTTSYSSYEPAPSFTSDSYSRKPKISAEVNEDFYDSIQEYCRKNSITVSALIRSAVGAYINTGVASVSVASSPSIPRITGIVRPDGSWQCPMCGNVNASYVGTCSCGTTKN